MSESELDGMEMEMKAFIAWFFFSIYIIRSSIRWQFHISYRVTISKWNTQFGFQFKKKKKRSNCYRIRIFEFCFSLLSTFRFVFFFLLQPNKLFVCCVYHSNVCHRNSLKHVTQLHHMSHTSFESPKPQTLCECLNNIFMFV